MAFGTRYRVMVIALFRSGAPVLDRVADVTLRDGDVLLIQGDLEPLGESSTAGICSYWRRRPSRSPALEVAGGGIFRGHAAGRRLWVAALSLAAFAAVMRCCSRAA